MVPETTDISKSARMRPRIERELGIPSDDVLLRIRESLHAEECRCTGTLLGKHVELHVKEEHRHFWSPWFSGDVDASGCQRSVLHGRFGPSPGIWTGFAACYAMFIFGAIGALMYGASQWMIDQPPWALWLVPGFGISTAALYVLARIGRRLACEQIGWMLQLLDCSLDGQLECAQTRCAACPSWTSSEVVAGTIEPAPLPALSSPTEQTSHA